MPLNLKLAPSPRSVALSAVRLFIWLAPAMLLAFAAGRDDNGTTSLRLLMGAVLELVVVGVLMFYRRTWAPSIDSSLLVLYLGGLGWFSFNIPNAGLDWYVNVTRAVLIVVPLGIVAAYTINQSGAFLFRRAYKLGQRLAARTKWPSDLNMCRNLPEVKAFREAVQFEATPAIMLLDDPRPEVRVCALAALEFRLRWRAGQAEKVLYLLQREEVPEVRVAAVYALANIDDRQMLELVANSLRDPDPRVRRSAADALFWNSDRRWSWMRYGVRRALSEPALYDDGPLIQEGQKLSPESVDDLTAWAAEKGVLGLRSTQTLAVHYARVLYERPDETLAMLYKTVSDVQAPPLLRIELGQMLKQGQALNPSMLESFLDQVNPAPLRLIGADGLLEIGHHAGAVACLRDIARLPNRDLALTTAEVVQRRLGVDVGLAIGQPLPPLNSPKAIEVTRRLMAWAARHEYPAEEQTDSAASPSPLRQIFNN